jgi:hypothetical protein
LSSINKELRSEPGAVKRAISAFLHYRQPFPVLVSCAAWAIFRPRQTVLARVAAAALLTLLLMTPVLIIVIGNRNLGNAVALATGVLFWPVLWELPFVMDRAQSSESFTPSEPSVKVVVTVGISIVLACVLPGLANDLEGDLKDVPSGFVWGLAIAGANDVVRSMVAMTLAWTGGIPLYRPRASDQPNP